MNDLNTHNDVLNVIKDYIHKDGYFIFRTPLVQNIIQYPYSNLVFVHSRYDNREKDNILAEMKNAHVYRHTGNQDIVSKVFAVNEYPSLLQFILSEIKNNPLVRLFKYLNSKPN